MHLHMSFFFVTLQPELCACKYACYMRALKKMVRMVFAIKRTMFASPLINNQ